MASCGPSRGFNLCAVLETQAQHLNASQFCDTGSGVLCLQPLYCNASPVFNDLKAWRKLILWLITFLKMKQEIKRHNKEEGNGVGFSPLRCPSQLHFLCKTKQPKNAPSVCRSTGVLFLANLSGGFWLIFLQFSPTQCALTQWTPRTPSRWDRDVWSASGAKIWRLPVPCKAEQRVHKNERKKENHPLFLSLCVYMKNLTSVLRLPWWWLLLWVTAP